MWSNSTKWWNWKELNRFPPYTSVVVYLLAHSIPFLHEIRQRCKVSLHTNHPAELPGCRLTGRPASCPPTAVHTIKNRKSEQLCSAFYSITKGSRSVPFFYTYCNLVGLFLAGHCQTVLHFWWMLWYTTKTHTLWPVYDVTENPGRTHGCFLSLFGVNFATWHKSINCASFLNFVGF